MSEHVEIVQYDPRWTSLYAEEETKILGVAGNHVVAIEHFGSTAVPGLAAKPVIDIVIAVPTSDDLDTLTEPLRGLGYLPWPYPDRRLHVKWVNGIRTHHAHVVVHGSQFWDERRLFRDYLRENSSAAREYEQVKRELAVRYRTDREAYTEAKSRYIQSLNRAAKLWRQHT